MTKLLDDEIEEDEAFWNQDSLREVVFIFIFIFLTFLKSLHSTF